MSTMDMKQNVYAKQAMQTFGLGEKQESLYIRGDIYGMRRQQEEDWWDTLASVEERRGEMFGLGDVTGTATHQTSDTLLGSGFGGSANWDNDALGDEVPWGVGNENNANNTYGNGSSGVGQGGGAGYTPPELTWQQILAQTVGVVPSGTTFGT